MKSKILTSEEKKVKKLNKKLKNAGVKKVNRIVNTKLRNDLEVSETVTSDKTFRGFGKNTIETLKKIKDSMIRYYNA